MKNIQFGSQMINAVNELGDCEENNAGTASSDPHDKIKKLLVHLTFVTSRNGLAKEFWRKDCNKPTMLSDILLPHDQ